MGLITRSYAGPISCGTHQHLGLIDIGGRQAETDRVKLATLFGGTQMAWSKPIIREIECGMEINMYGPDGDRESDGGVLF